VRIALAILMALHGVAHGPGVVGSWRLAALEGIPYHTTLFGGAVDVGDAGMRVVGVAWLLAGAGFVAASAAALADRPWWPPLAAAVTLLSLALCVAELPATRVGLPVNVAILLVLLADREFAVL
jgi:hypothetical protein